MPESIQNLAADRSGHTPGPWHQFDNGGVTASGYEYGLAYADVVWGPNGPGYGIVCDCSPYAEPESIKSIANARLIAAAPSMLALLKTVQRVSCNFPDWWFLDHHDQRLQHVIESAEIDVIRSERSKYDQ